jgi:hypothetical protein
MPLWVLAVYALAVARLTALVTVDWITEPARAALVRRLPANRAGEFVSELITCQWCASIWVAAAAAPVVWWHSKDGWAIVAGLILAASQITGMMSQLGRR